MLQDHFLIVLFIISIASGAFYVIFRFSKYAFFLNNLIIGILILFLHKQFELILIVLSIGCPLLLIKVGMYVFLHKVDAVKSGDKKYQVNFATDKGNFKLENIKRGAPVIGSAGSGKTDSVVYGFLKHFRKEVFCGIIHDYKDFELTEMAYPLFKESDIPFKIISFDKIIHRVNPIAPRYLENEKSVNEVSRVLIENLLEQRESGSSGTSKFFNDAAEGLIGGLIWKLKTSYPKFCT